MAARAAASIVGAVSAVRRPFLAAILRVACVSPGLAAVAIACGACIASLPPAPPVLAVPGVKVETQPFTRELLTTFPARSRSNRVMHIGGRSPAGLMILTEQGIRWIDRAGATLRDVPFAGGGRLFRPVPYPVAQEATSVIGLAGRDDVVVFGLDGTRHHRFGTGAHGYDWPIAADVIGDARPEIVVKRTRGAAIMDIQGTTVGSLRWSRYTTFVATVQADDDPQDEIVLFNTHIGRPDVEVRVANADGSVVADWAVAEGNWLFRIPELGKDQLWSAVGDELVARSVQGAVLTRLAAPAAGYLRYVSGARLGDLTVMLVSGGGYRCNSLLFVYDTANELVYQEALTARSYALWADHEEGAFLLGSGDVVYRYRPADAPLQSRVH